ncbi:M56 family metallopeptidase [Streptomyces sp. NPDC087300]|uniref:M56 family metallopeptidase n=1 Tax=Streptomyces sp. NPDC087300 TaxID=3365780 RepID=UPI003824199D
MRIDVYVPLVLSALLAAISPAIGRYLAPAPATRALTLAAVLSAASTTWALLLLSATLITETPPVEAQARQDGRRLAEPVPETVAYAAVLVLALVAYRLQRVLRAQHALRRAQRRLCESHPSDAELIVVDSAVAEAFAVPGAPGRILASSAMLNALEPAERRVLLAHERAHLTHHHALLSVATALASAANPLLKRLHTTVAFLIERWADEHAAHAVGDRGTAARALARAALTAHSTRPADRLAFTDHTVTRRIAALRTSPPPNLRVIAALVLALGASAALGAADATNDLVELLARALPW